MTAPTVRLRLSAEEVRLILPALQLIVSADHDWATTGVLPRAAADHRFYEKTLDARKYNSASMKSFLTAVDKVSHVTGGGRLRLDAFELAACILSVRHTRRMVGHGHLLQWLEDHTSPADRLISKLERYRRRARRLIEKREGVGKYEDRRKGWTAILAWVRTNYLRCPCNQPKGWASIRRWRRSVIDQCMTPTAEALKRRYCYPPATAELRRMVRAALRSVRRGHAQMTIKGILENPRQGGDCLADYIIRTRGKELRHFDLCTIQSARAARLTALHSQV